MKSFWKNPLWHLTIGIFFLAFTIFLLVYLIMYKWGSRADLVRDIVRLFLFAFFGTSSLLKWQKMRKANTNLTNEKDL
jgi:hypothetical protein